ncbi:hypothetical protein SERLADRAFT_466320 [Serpula lacrymans var. lacrymans S7.9]|uniref:Uncharacterized protein n=1 Tax=Serpula lacrymans var. lacrymans (strain S7.9) TaxID=578457 RepID=F8NTS4_SERL9|nr:uncharacterized protein SERLADRAFT_466320 [Serpula lacrymans var. lacrymans S7.9]EGO25744.1 hypothetical protein SERLADRAFT_466320 [Serpula lacrymans var. lacrymans S7.9]
MLSGGLKEFDVENLKAMLENSDDEDFDDESNWSEKVEAGSVASAESTDTVKGTARNENENHLLTEAQAMDKGRAAKQNTAIDKNDAGEQTGTVDQTQGSTDGLRVGGSRDEIKDQADAHLSSADPLAQAGAAVGKQDEMSDCSSEDGTGERPRKRKRAEAEQA